MNKIIYKSLDKKIMYTFVNKFMKGIIL